MTDKDVKEMFDEMKAQGYKDEDILGIIYTMYQKKKFETDDLRKMTEILGYKFTDEFEAMSEEDKHEKGLTHEDAKVEEEDKKEEEDSEDKKEVVDEKKVDEEKADDKKVEEKEEEVKKEVKEDKKEDDGDDEKIDEEEEERRAMKIFGFKD